MMKYCGNCARSDHIPGNPIVQCLLTKAYKPALHHCSEWKSKESLARTALDEHTDPNVGQKYTAQEVRLRTHSVFWDEQAPPLVSELYCACYDSNDWPKEQRLNDDAKDALKALLEAYDKYLD